MKVSVYKIRKVSKGMEYDYWQVNWSMNGKKKRQAFTSKNSADTFAADLRVQQKTAGSAWLTLSHGERNDLMLLYNEARQHGITLRQAWELVKNGEHLKNVASEQCTLKKAMDETIAAKIAAQRRPRYVESLRDYLKAFIAGREGAQISSITVAMLERWFDERKEAPSTRASNRGRLSAMFSLCVRRGYIKGNPCDRLERITIERKPRTIFKPDEVKKLLTACQKSEKSMLPYFVLGIFAGLRPESELLKLHWSNIDVRRGIVRVEKTKVNYRRVVQLHKTARRWLAVCKVPKSKDSPVVPKQSRRKRRRVVKKAELAWVQDIMRHTAASYLLAFYKDAGKVAVMLGHSAKILYQHYHELVDPKDARAFWSILP